MTSSDSQELSSSSFFRFALQWGILGLILLLLFFALSSGGDSSSESPAVVTGGGGGSATPREVTPQGSPADEGSGPSAQEIHTAAAEGLTPGAGQGGSTNSLNPERARQTTPETSHTEPPVIIVPSPEPPCDPNDPHSPCYEPPCDPSDPHAPCYEPPPYQHNDECDPSSPYYDPNAICL